MISIARIFGAPRQRAGGKHASAARRSRRPPARSVPRDLGDDVDHVRVGLDLHQLARRATLPYSHTRPRSLRPRSTSITCSARSFSSASSSAAIARPRRRAPRGRVPAIGRVETCAAVDRQQRLGRGADDLEVLEVEEVHVRRRVDRAQPAVDRERLDRRRRATSAGDGTTWKASPAWMYSMIRATMASNASRGMLDSNCGSGRARVRLERAAAGRRAGSRTSRIASTARACAASTPASSSR